MEREMSIKYLLREFLRKIKVIILAGVVFALLFSLYSWMSLSKQQGAQLYSSYGKLYVKKNVDNVVDTKRLDEIIKDREFRSEVNSRVNEKIEEIMKTQDYTEENISFFTSDAVLSQVVKDPEVRNGKLSIDEIRDMLYLRGRENGAVIEIYAVEKDEKVAELVCSKLIQYGSAYFKERDYEVNVTQDVTELGPVSLELRESLADPRDKNAIITEMEIPVATMGNMLSKGILGFLAGILLSCIWVCVRFIARDYLIYAGQVESTANIKLLAAESSKNRYWDIYSNLYLNNKAFFAVNFVSLKPLERENTFVSNFAETLGQAGKKVLAIEYVDQPLKKEDELALEQKAHFSYARVSDYTLLKTDELSNIISSFKSEYDLVLFQCANVDEKPVGKLLSMYTDETVLLIESNTVKTNELENAKESFEESGVKISGVVFG